MILVQVEIFEFKSISHVKLPVNDIMCLVGKNESGKTNIIEAISYLNFLNKRLTLYHTTKSSKRYRKEFPLISGLFSINKNDFNFFTEFTYGNDVVDMLSLAESLKSHNTGYVEIKRWGNSFSDIELKILDKNKSLLLKPTELIKDKSQLSEFLDRFFIELYPTIDFFSDEEFTIEPASTEDLLSNNSKFDSFRRLLKVGGIDNMNLLNSEVEEVTELTSDAETVLTEIFRKYYLQDKTISILIRPSSMGKWNVLIKDSTKKTYKLTERSPGFQYFFAFIFNKYYLNGNSNNNSIYLLDEPGKSLHPKGSKDLLRTFKYISEKSQIIYTTHNAFLAVRDNIDNLLLVTKNNKEGTKINLKPYNNKYEVLRKELGILLNDSFILSDINLLVEGATEKLALHRIFNEENSPELEWVNIINCETVSKIRPTIKYLNDLGLKGIVLVDSDTAGKSLIDNINFKKLTKDVKRWQVMEIDDLFSSRNKERTFEDLFSHKFYIKAYNMYYSSNNDVIDFKVNFNPLDEKSIPNTAIIKTVQAHLKKFSDTSLNKVAVARIYFELINTEKGKKVINANIDKLSNLIESKVKKLII